MQYARVWVHTGPRSYNQHKNSPNHDRHRKIWGPRGPREAQYCVLTHWINWGQLPKQVGLLLGGGLIGPMAFKVLHDLGDDALPQHWSIFRAVHPLNPHKKHICLLGGLFPIDQMRRCRMKGLLWGTRGPLPLAVMVVMVVLSLGAHVSTLFTWRNLIRLPSPTRINVSVCLSVHPSVRHGPMAFPT